MYLAEKVWRRYIGPRMAMNSWLSLPQNSRNDWAATNFSRELHKAGYIH